MKSGSEHTPLNGIAISKRAIKNPEYRTYEVHQRERVGQSTEKIQPIKLIDDAQLADPFDNLAILREHYPCYRDWLGNAYWLTRYDDVTSVFADRANFHAPNRAQQCGLTGADLSATIPAHSCWGALIDDALPAILDAALQQLKQSANPDVSIDFALYIANELSRQALGFPEQQREWLAPTLWYAQRADSRQPQIAERGQQALVELKNALEEQLPKLRMVSTSLAAACPDASASDLIATLLGLETRTLYGGIANICQAWLAAPEVRSARHRK